jgi:hypothetical protein
MVEEYPLTNIAFTTVPPQCNGDENGSINYSSSDVDIAWIEWFNFGETDTLSGIDAGIYNYDGQDVNGCTFFGNIMVLDPPEFEVTESLFEDVDNCPLYWSGELDFEGGVAPYESTWTLTDDLGVETIVEDSVFNCFLGGDAAWTVTDANGCVVSGSQEIGVIIGLEEQSTQRIQVYPNPCNELLYIQGIQPGTPFIIKDVLGKTQISDFTTQSTTELSVAQLPSGIYFIQTPNGHIVRFVKK